MLLGIGVLKEVLRIPLLAEADDNERKFLTTQVFDVLMETGSDPTAENPKSGG